MHQRLMASLLIATMYLTGIATAQVSPFADRAPELLSEYIRIDTQNPPGNETRGAQFIARIFDDAGIDYAAAESADGPTPSNWRLPAIL